MLTRDEGARAPLEKTVDLSTVPQAGVEIVLEVAEADHAKLAQWAGVEAVQAFSAAVELQKLSQTRFRYQARVRAEVVQSCVVTLVPVVTPVRLDFGRELHLVRHLRPEIEAPLQVSPADDDTPEEIEDPRFDVAGPVLEEFVLAIDPYPRAPGVEFAPPEPEPKPESPFAVLARLKQGQ